MVDSQRMIVKEDGGSDCVAVIECARCDKRVYVYAENEELPITIGDLPCFCRWCGKAYGAWAIEFHGAWSPLASTCSCKCGCEVPLEGGTCVDCGEDTHQNNNKIVEYDGRGN